VAEGSKNMLALMELLTRPPDLESVFLTAEEADEMERKGFRVARIPIKPASDEKDQ
jgi:hypothetical protein